MKKYQLNENAAKRIISASLPIQILIIIFAIILGLYLGVRGNFYEPSLLISIPFVIIITCFSFRSSAKRVEMQWSTYELQIEDDLLIKRQKNFEELVINKNEIVSLVEIQGKGLTVKTNNKMRFIFIPNGINEYQEIKEILESWKPIAVKQNSLQGQLITIGVAVITLVLIFLFESGYNQYVKAFSGCILIAILLVSWLMTLKNPNLDQKVKKSSWVILILLGMFILKLIIMVKDSKF